MRKHIVSITAFTVMLALAGAAWAGGLNKEQLRKGIAARIENAIKQRRPDAQVDLGSSDVKLQRIEPTSVSVEDTEIALYAIKARVKSPVRSGQSSSIRMVVNRSGELQLSVRRVATGDSLVQEAKDVVRRKKIDSDWGRTVFQGGGSHDVFLVVDPFCGYCRKAVSWFLDHRGSIAELKIMQVPFSRERGGDVAAWAFTDGAGTVEAEKLLKYLYSGDLEPVGQNATGKAKSGILKQVMREFPALKKKWGTPEQGYYYLKGKFKDEGRKNIRIAQQQLGVRATPGVFVDGIPIKGWNPRRYSELLAQE